MEPTNATKPQTDESSGDVNKFIGEISAQMGLRDVLARLLELPPRSGILRIMSKEVVGFIRIADSRIINGVFEKKSGQTGLEALRRVFECKKGLYGLIPDSNEVLIHDLTLDIPQLLNWDPTGQSSLVQALDGICNPPAPDPVQPQYVPPAPEPIQPQYVPPAPEPIQPQYIPPAPEPIQPQYIPPAPEPVQQQYVPPAPEPVQQQYIPPAPEPVQPQYIPPAPEPVQPQYVPPTPQPVQPQFVQPAAVPPQVPPITDPRQTLPYGYAEQVRNELQQQQIQPQQVPQQQPVQPQFVQPEPPQQPQPAQYPNPFQGMVAQSYQGALVQPDPRATWIEGLAAIADPNAPHSVPSEAFLAEQFQKEAALQKTAADDTEHESAELPEPVMAFETEPEPVVQLNEVQEEEEPPSLSFLGSGSFAPSITYDSGQSGATPVPPPTPMPVQPVGPTYQQQISPSDMQLAQRVLDLARGAQAVEAPAGMEMPPAPSTDNSQLPSWDIPNQSPNSPTSTGDWGAQRFKAEPPMVDLSKITTQQKMPQPATPNLPATVDPNEIPLEQPSAEALEQTNEIQQLLHQHLAETAREKGVPLALGMNKDPRVSSSFNRSELDAISSPNAPAVNMPAVLPGGTGVGQFDFGERREEDPQKITWSRSVLDSIKTPDAQTQSQKIAALKAMETEKKKRVQAEEEEPKKEKKPAGTLAVVAASVFFMVGACLAIFTFNIAMRQYQMKQAYNVALLFFKEGNGELARKKFDEILVEDTKDVVAYFYRAVSSYKLNEHERAFEDFDQITKLRPGDPAGYIGRATSNIKLKNYEEAKADCDQVLKIRPNSFDALRIRAIANAYLGDNKQVIKDCDAAFATKPKHGLAEIYSNRGFARFKLRQYPEALSDFNNAVNLSPKDVLAYESRAQCFKVLGKYDSAISDLDKAIFWKPRDVPAYLLRSQCYVAVRKYDKAVKDCDMAISVDPAAETHAARADVFCAMGNFKAALVDMDRAVELQPGNRTLEKKRLNIWAKMRAAAGKK